MRRSVGVVVALLVLAGPLESQRIQLPKKLEELPVAVRADSNDAYVEPGRGVRDGDSPPPGDSGRIGSA